MTLSTDRLTFAAKQHESPIGVADYTSSSGGVMRYVSDATLTRHELPFGVEGYTQPLVLVMVVLVMVSASSGILTRR